MLVVPTADAQPSEQRPYVVTAWGMEQGLPQSSVNDILQTRDGYIWLATFGGLVRFDGVNFTTYNRFNTECMRTDRILRLFEDSEARLWVSTEDGLLRFEDGNCRFYEFGQVANSPTAMIVRQDVEGYIWASIYETTYLLEGDEFVAMDIEFGESLVLSAVSNPNGLWLGYSEKLLRTYGRRIVLIQDFGDATTDIIDVVEHPAGSGIVYLGTSGKGIFRYKNGHIQSVGIVEREHSKFIWKLHVDQNQQLWALNFYGMSLYNGTSFEDYDPKIGIDDVVIVTVFSDLEGNRWLGSTSMGLFQLRESVISMIDRDQGLETEQMLSMSRTPDGRVLFATNCGGVYEWKNGRAVPFSANRFITNQCVWSVFVDSKGRHWFGSRTLYRMDAPDKPGVELSPSDGAFPFANVNAITEDRSGNIWFGSMGGVVRYDGTNYHAFPTSDSRVLYEDRAGRMWIGTTDGVMRIEGDVITTMDLETQPYVRAIHEDADGVMWFGTYGSGIYRWENGVVTNIRKEHGLYDNIVSHLVEDENGVFWSGSNNGIFRTSRAMLNRFHRKEIMRVRSEFYGKRDGMNSAETNGGFQPNVIRDEDGNLYFPTVMGVAKVSTRKAAENERIPPVYITSIRSDSRELSQVSSIELPYNNPYLEIEYTALYYRDAAKLRFRYRLEGLDESWLEVGDRRSALFTRLPSGTYTFNVTASADGTVWNETGASIDIIVVPPYWDTPWFRGILAVILLTLGPAVYATRVNQLKTEQEKQKRFTEQLIESQENERRRIAAELHDGLGQQILVIKNRAEMAQFTVSDHEKTSHHLTEIMQSAMSSISDVRSITQDLRPVHLERFGLTDSLNTLCEEVRQTANLECSYHIENIDDLIPADLQIHFYRVIQEGITNIQKHSQAENASVFVKRSDSGIRAVLWDDGIGFNPLSNTISAGLGLTGMRERMETLGGTIDFNSSPEEGTTITLKIPTSTHG
jgi:signal transduction histidine kinase/ligand-binding sensor domain-containing protein